MFPILGGGVLTETRCATKEWINLNYPNIAIDKEYENNQLVGEDNLSVGLTTILYIEGPFKPTQRQTFTTNRALDTTKPFRLTAKVCFHNMISSKQEDSAFSVYPSNSTSNDTLICKLMRSTDGEGYRIGLAVKDSGGSNNYVNYSPVNLGTTYSVEYYFDGIDLYRYIDGIPFPKTPNFHCKSADYTRVAFNGSLIYSYYYADVTISNFKLEN